jgi:eukaryotic-like serine/threonine-protein kinase
VERHGVGGRIGNYRIERELAQDARLISFSAMHLVLPRRAMIKVLRTDHALAVGMLREACVLDALRHPGIARVYESGVLDGRPWFALELIEGHTLRSILAPGAIDRVDAIALLRDLAEVIEHAYHRGIVHCGLRPERIVLTGRNRGFPLCIADWSDARMHDSRLQQLSPDAVAWHYTPPELVRGEPIDDRTDVFALGVIAYQMLTGRMPYDLGVHAIVDDGRMQHVPMTVHCPDLPPELGTLVDSMLAYDRWDRPSVAEVFADLAFLADALATPVHSRPAVAGTLRMRRPRWTPSINFDRSVSIVANPAAERSDVPRSEATFRGAKRSSAERSDVPD